MGRVSRIKERSVIRIDKPCTHIDIQGHSDSAGRGRNGEVSLDLEFKFSVEFERERSPFAILEDRAPYRDACTNKRRVDSEGMVVVDTIITIFKTFAGCQPMNFESYSVIYSRRYLLAGKVDADCIPNMNREWPLKGEPVILVVRFVVV